ncbi:MAG TPA: hypothetical protein VHT68_21005 [Pseudolabrys sp.]|jgi:hypothetical protein|nr:hypothetical protein [Pseudolabrys sp.]
MDISKRLSVVGHGRAIRRPHYEDGRQLADLERRIQIIEWRFELIADLLLGLVSAGFAIIGAAYASGGFYRDQMIAAAVIAFFVAMWMTNSLFPNITRRWLWPTY